MERNGGGNFLDGSILLRRARSDDAQALLRLAQRDSTVVPSEPLLVAESRGELRAAVPLAGGAAIADPFHPTAELVQLLEMRAAQLARGSTGRGSGRRAQ